MNKRKNINEALKQLFVASLAILFTGTLISPECIMARTENAMQESKITTTTKNNSSIKYVRYEERSTLIADMKQPFNPGYIFVGDSRFVGMDMVVSVEAKENQFLIAECGKGCQWLKNTAETKMEEICAAHPEITDWYLVTNLGVNDRYNEDAYVEEYEKLAEEYTILFVSVNPLESIAGSDVDKINAENAEVNALNDAIKDSEAVSYYIDTHTYMIENGFQTVDGLHYTNSTYQNIYDYIEEAISDI